MGVDMEELIARVTSAANITPDQARRAIGLIFAFLKKEGPTADVGSMLQAVPGAPEAAAAGEADKPATGGLMGSLMSAMGGSGGLMDLASQLGSLGLGTGEMASVGKEIFGYAKEKAGEERVAAVAKAIPGLESFL